tara:strand:- start:267 stop:380 length:114 start_codon:yes stop_codon:yes gene_type:complete
MLVAVEFGEFARTTGEEKEVHGVCVGVERAVSKKTRV